MRLAFHRIDELPKLAWCVEIQRFQDVVDVFHGPWVETTETFFCEGAWSGEFSSGKLEEAMLVWSAGKITKQGLLLATPNNTLERIYLQKNGDSVVAANSLAFLLAHTHDDVDMRCLFYRSRLASILEGLEKYVRWLPTRDGRRIHVYYHCNVLVNSDLEVIEEAKKPAPEFRDFTEYKMFLEEQVAGIHANANDPRRRVKYRPIVTISVGYDSPAAAVLAKRVGCTEAVTIRQARGRARIRFLGSQTEKAGECDSGEEIAAILGMEVKAFDRLDYLKETSHDEAENCGGPLVFAAWGKKLEGRLLFTGFNGDKIWDRNCEKVSPHIVRGDYSGSTFNEFRLRVGFLHLAVPFLGCTSHPSIHKISTSLEMKPWSMGNGYDRPIARRLVEEAGVPRGLFGMRKKAVEVVVRDEGMGAMLREESLADFALFIEEHWNLSMRLKVLAVKPFREFLRVAGAVERRLGRGWKLQRLIPRNLRVMTYGYVGRESLLFHWAVKRLLPRYKWLASPGTASRVGVHRILSLPQIPSTLRDKDSQQGPNGRVGVQSGLSL